MSDCCPVCGSKEVMLFEKEIRRNVIVDGKEVKLEYTSVDKQCQSCEAYIYDHEQAIYQHNKFKEFIDSGGLSGVI